MQRRRANNLWFFVCAPLMLAGCNTPSTQFPKASDAELAHEEDFQRRMVEKAAEKGGDPRPWRNRKNMQKQFEAVAERIEKAGAELCQAMGLPKLKRRCYYYFDTSRDLEINAYATGKYIVITRGMLRFVQDDNELAMVMGHEFAHNIMGHIEAAEENRQGGKLVGTFLDELVGTRGAYQDSWSAKGEFVGAISYSQSFESEADYVGMYVAARAGYDIKKAVGMWRRMSVEEPDGVYNATTHPANPERFVILQKTIAEIEDKRKRRVPLVPHMEGVPVEGDYEARSKFFDEILKSQE